MEDRISGIEKILLERGDITDSPSIPDSYCVKHDFDFDEFCSKNLCCPYSIDSDSRYVFVRKDILKEMIVSAIEKGFASKQLETSYKAFDAGEDAHSSYTNHLSDCESYYFSGIAQLILEIASKDDPEDIMIMAKISGEIYRFHWNGSFNHPSHSRSILRRI